MILLDLIVIIEPAFGARDESSHRCAGVTQTFLPEQSILFVKILISPFLNACIPTLILLLFPFFGFIVFGEFRASIKSEGILVMFGALFHLLNSHLCEVTNQVFDQVERSDCRQSILGELAITIIDLT